MKKTAAKKAGKKKVNGATATKKKRGPGRPRKKDEGAARLGKKGQAAWMAATTPEQRSEYARNAALAKWAKESEKE